MKTDGNDVHSADEVSLSTPQRHVGGSRRTARSFLTSAQDAGNGLASRPGLFTPVKEAQYPLNRRLGGPQSRAAQFGEKGDSRFVHLTTRHQGDQIVEDTMASACGTYGGEIYTRVYWGNPKESTRLENLDVNANIIKINLKELQWDWMDQIHLAQDRDKWWALEATVTSIWLL